MPPEQQTPQQTSSSPRPQYPTIAAPEPSGTGPKKPRQLVRDIVSVVAVLASALLLAFALISFVFQSYQVEGPSMQSTLQDQDHLIVWKVPRTIARITGHAYIPNRGDVVIFNEPGLADFGSAQDKQLIKRVIGLPGERVVVKDNVVTVYNKEHPEGFQPDKTLPYGNVIPATNGSYDVTLKPGQLFVCGDNRPQSLDSRVFGPIDANNIIGKLVIRVLPITEVKTF